MSKIQKRTKGIPELPTFSDTCDKCPICLHEKLFKASRNKEDPTVTTTCNQGISVDFGFIVVRSQNKERFDHVVGLNGETCYCIITYDHSGTVYGGTFRSKSPPIDWLNRWLVSNGCTKDEVDGIRFARFDQGGDLGASNKVVELFEAAGYDVQITATDASASLGMGERPHRTIGDALRAMLHGAGLDAKFWPYAFHHFLRIYNCDVHGDRTMSPFEMCTVGSQYSL